MQNTGSPYTAPTQQGNYTDHNYDSSMGGHCQQSGYPMYVNGPYPSGPLPPPHYYGSHQMQQGGHYRGNYGPPPPPPPPHPQNQYGAPSNHDMYRNHHPPYGRNPRNLPGKPVWGNENTSPDMVPMYNNVASHTQMNSSSSMNASTMRSPPHLPSNINHAPSPGPQHYRQMQSPTGSPQTWTQVQVPSPGIQIAARTTPSPLQAHARSPGHSQPFSPPSSTHIAAPSNMVPPQTIIPPSAVDGCHSIQVVNQHMSNKVLPTDPLHSLQKMLEQDDIHSPGTDLPAMECHQSFPPVMVDKPGTPEESKDSGYATYFNLDENRLESEPQRSTPKPSVFLPITPVEPTVESNDVLSSDPLIDPQPMRPTFVVPEQTEDLVYTNCTAKVISSPKPLLETRSLSELVSVKNEFNSNSNNVSGPFSKSPGVAVESVDGLPVKSSSSEPQCKLSLQKSVSNIVPKVENSVKILPNANLHEAKQNSIAPTPTRTDVAQSNLTADTDNLCGLGNKKTDSKSSTELLVKPSSKAPSIIKLKAVTSSDQEKLQNEVVDVKPKVETLANCNVKSLDDVVVKVCDVAKCIRSDVKHVMLSGNEVSVNLSGGNTKLVQIAADSVSKSISISRISKPNSISSDGYSKLKTASLSKAKIITAADIEHTPVKVVIHRIKTSSMNDTWHVPTKTEPSSSTEKPNLRKNSTKSLETSSKASSVGPQIIILSPAMSRKKFGDGDNSSGNPNVTSAKGSVASTENSKKGALKSILKAPPRPRKRRSTRSSTSSESPRASPRKLPGASVPTAKRSKKPSGPKRKVKSGTLKRRRKLKKKLISHKEENVQVVKTVPKPRVIKPFNGPYVHIEGPKSDPSSFTVVNVALKEEDKNKSTKGNVGVAETSRKPLRIGHSSTLSPHYDAFNKDKTWLCSFCQKGSHCCGLGDLYGPYYVQGEAETDPNNPENTPTSSTCRGIRQKRRKSDTSEGSRLQLSKKGRMSYADSNVTPVMTSEVSESPDQPTDGKVYKEVWIHEDCAVWCQDISLVGSQVQGLEEAIQEAMENLCSSCKLVGATLGCWIKGCKEQYHFCCAKEKGCLLDFEKFSVLCCKHKDARSAGRIRKT